MAQAFKHYTEFTGQWPWKNFSPKEVSCKHCGELYMHQVSMDALQKLRTAWGKPIIINSAHRCIVHNGKVGGAKDSQHLKIAFDCYCPALEQKNFIAAALEAGFTGIGKYPNKNFVHLDLGPARVWWG